MEYGHAQAVADGVNVDFDVYRIRTKVTEQGATLEQEDGTVVGRKAVMGALTLYLDFINLFLFMLRILGDRR